jgi:hypothetical protein
MTTAADDTAVQDAFEAYLAGRPVPDEAADGFRAVAAFSEAVRATATQPGRPNAALAELLATGLLTDQSSPSARTARSAGAPPSRRDTRIRNRRRFAMIFPVLLAKILSAGAVAQAATGAGIVLVAVTGAGAVGVLPDPLQNTVATVVETVTPLDLPSEDDEETVVDPVTDEVAEEEATDGTDPEDGAPVEGAEGELTLEQWQEGPAPEQSFGSWVSAGARHGFVDGQTVSEWAHKRNAERRGETETATPTATPTAEPTDGVTPEVEEETEATTSDRGGKANGNGRGNGRN